MDAVASKQVLYRQIYAVHLASQRNSACIVVALTSPDAPHFPRNAHAMVPLCSVNFVQVSAQFIKILFHKYSPEWQLDDP